MNTLPPNPEGWEDLWSQAQLPCSGDSLCPGCAIFERVKKAFDAQRPGEHETHPLGLLLTDLAVDHCDCIHAVLQQETLHAFCSDLSMQTEGTLSWAAAALSTNSSTNKPPDTCGSCGRTKCAGGRRCNKGGAAPKAKCCSRAKCRGGRRCLMNNPRPGDQVGNASLMLRNSLEAVLHGCDGRSAICSRLLLAHARQKVQDVDVQGLFITGLAGALGHPLPTLHA